MPERALTAMLLVGGLSTRMGQDKATISTGSKPLWQRQLHVLQKLQPAVLAVSARATPPWIPPDIEMVLDRPPSRGPLSGISAALRSLKTSHLLVLAVDMPRMTPEHLAALWNSAEPGQGVIPQRDEHLEPLCAIYPAQAAILAEELLNKETLSLQHFARQLIHQAKARLYPLSPLEQPLYFNMNTPCDTDPAPSLAR